MKHELTDGVIHFETRGHGKPLLVLHGGYLDHNHMMDALEPCFDEDSTWRRIYPDTPGHGLTTIADSVKSHDQVLEILLEFMAMECPNEIFAVVGESRGGFLARGLAAKTPEYINGLMLIAPGRYATANPLDLPPKITLESAVELIPELKRSEIPRFENLVVQNREILNKIRQYKIPAIELSNSSYQHRINENYEFSFDVDDAAVVFSKPALFLLGRNDTEVGYKNSLRIIENYPRATFAILDKAGHSLAWEQPRLFRAMTKDWLDRVEKCSS